MIQNRKGWVGGVYDMSLSTLMLCLFLMVLSSQAQSRCNAPDQRELFELSDIVFAAELTFSHIDFIKRESDSGYYLKKYFYKYKTLHVWKGDPGSEGMAFPAGPDHIAIYEYPLLSEYDQAKSEHMRSEAPTIKLMYAHQSEHGLVYGGCSYAEDFEIAVWHRLMLGEPIKSYGSEEYHTPTTDDLFAVLDRMNSPFDDEVQRIEYFAYINDAVQALLYLDQQQAMIDYLSADRFMHCDQTNSNLSVVTMLLWALPEHVETLRDRFGFLLSCPQEQMRFEVFTTLSRMVSSASLLLMIEQFMSDPSAKLRKAAAENVFRLTGEGLQSMLDRAEVMLSSDAPYDRLFAAVMLNHTRRIDSELIRMVCDAEPATWSYGEYEIESDNIQRICQDMLNMRYY